MGRGWGRAGGGYISKGGLMKFFYILIYRLYIFRHLSNTYKIETNQVKWTVKLSKYRI